MAQGDLTKEIEKLKVSLNAHEEQVKDLSHDLKAAEQRLKNTEPIEENYLDTIKNNRSKLRIPFGSLVELGIIKPGTTIFDNKKKISAKKYYLLEKY